MKTGKFLIKNSEMLSNEHHLWSYNLAVESMVYLTCTDGESWGDFDLENDTATLDNLNVCKYLEYQTVKDFFDSCLVVLDVYNRLMNKVDACIHENLMKVVKKRVIIPSRSLLFKAADYIVKHSVESVIEGTGNEITGFINRYHERFYDEVYDKLELLLVNDSQG